MGVPVLVLGPSGSGKSTSLRNFEREEIAILNVAGKQLPFRKQLDTLNHARYNQIHQKLSANNRRAFVIDDSQYLMAFDSFSKAKQKGYDKFTDMAVAFEGLLEAAAKTNPDTIVYFLHHTEIGDDGRVKAKTIGKMLDNQLTVEGLFPIVLLAVCNDGEYCFVTNSDGTNPCKSPMDMLDNPMDNDLKAVDTAIREYWGLAPIVDPKPEPAKKPANKKGAEIEQP